MTGAARTVASVLRDGRKRTGLTQEALADALGVRQPAISNWESGRSYPSMASLLSVAALYDLDVKEILELQVAEEEAGRRRTREAVA